MFFPPIKEPQITDSLIKNEIKYAKKQQQKIRQQKLLQQQLVNQALFQQPSKRKNSDHQIIWKHFEGFDFFRNIEHDFSIFSKIQAIGHLRSWQQVQINEKQIQTSRKGEKSMYLTAQPEQGQYVSISFQHTLLETNRIVLLSSDYLKAINKLEQQRIKQKVQTLRKYSSLSSLRFEHLLYLAFYSTVKSFNFKDVIYKTGDQPLQCYFVQQGQFHIIFQQQIDFEQKNRYDKYKSVNKNKHKLNLSQINESVNLANQNSLQNLQKQQLPKSKTKQKKNPDLLKYDDPSPNRIYKKFKKESRLNIILGGMGSCFGEQQLVLGGKRLYKAECASTENILIAIRKEHYLNILNAVPEFKKCIEIKINNQNLQKNAMIDKIKETKSNLKKYIAEINRSTQKLQNKQFQKPQGNISNLQKRDYFKDNQQYEENLSLLPQLGGKRKAYSNVKSSSRANLSNVNSKTVSIGSLQLTKNKSNQGVGEDSYHQGFGLTNVSGNIKNSVEASPYRQQKKIQFKKPQKLPSITSISSPNHSFNDVIQIRVGKSWSTKKDKFLKAPERAKYIGMIDSQTLIKEKQYILSKKSKANTRKAIFPEYQDNLSKTNINLALKKAGQKGSVGQNKSLERQKSQQKLSIAHSKSFMQKMLISALQKSGYSSVNEQSNFQSQNRRKLSQPQSYHSQYGKKSSEGSSLLFKRPKNKNNIKNFYGSEIEQESSANRQTQKKNLFLQSNAFDNCYFRKL